MRCFVALAPSRPLAERIAAWSEETLAPLSWARPLPAGSLHVTLAFLGELDADGAGRAAEIVAAVTPRPVELRLDPELVAVPRRRPRVLALTATGERITDVHVAVSAPLVAAGLLPPPSRSLWPHLSVARARRGALDGRRGRAALAALPRLTGSAAEPEPAARLVLYRSELGAAGATYAALAQIELPAL